jgi:3-oxoacyl-[acyl-carrier-protein] synthase III
MRRSVIKGTGSYIPSVVKKNEDFKDARFLDASGIPINGSIESIISKFKQITGIEERRYVEHGQNTSDIATLAASEAIIDSGMNPEDLDAIIVAHNFGDVIDDRLQVDTVPALASRVKQNLSIKNPGCIAFDILFGCPGWIQGLIQVDAMFKSGQAQKAIVIGAEVLSRVVDWTDRDSMLFSDGAGATILEYSDGESGILSSAALSHCLQEADYLKMDEAYDPVQGKRYMKMKGRRVYEYALTHVPAAMKICLDKSGEDIRDLKKIFIHQANEKMDEAIVQAFYDLYGVAAPPDIMPMCIRYLGNSSVATIPTLYNLVRKGCDPLHSLSTGDLVLFASVGAGMNINAVSYRV